MAKQTIFIVEDDSDICRLVQHHLKTAGFATTAFSNGRTVIQEAEQARPSLFLLDVMVPGKDGFELCRTIRGGAVDGCHSGCFSDSEEQRGGSDLRTRLRC